MSAPAHVIYGVLINVLLILWYKSMVSLETVDAPSSGYLPIGIWHGNTDGYFYYYVPAPVHYASIPPNHAEALALICNVFVCPSTTSVSKAKARFSHNFAIHTAHAWIGCKSGTRLRQGHVCFSKSFNFKAAWSGFFDRSSYWREKRWSFLYLGIAVL